MKVAAAVFSTLSLVPTAQAGFELLDQQRSLQMCPTPDAGTPCTMELNPVKCGGSACEYDNQCAANAAGFSPGICWPSTCAQPSSNVACTYESNPVLCGDSKCPYANYCVAEAAGFPPRVCEAENCPGSTGMCTMEYDPFVCFAAGIGLCTYDNSCLATSSGFNIDVGECVRTYEYIANELGTCPAVATDAACPYIYDPIRCGQCVYSNDCEATSAGFSVADWQSCQPASCGAPSADVVCTMEFAPVRCMPDGCTYSNQCQATAAGYWEGSCVDANCPVPNPNTQCTMQYDPHTCTDTNGFTCTYDNLCVAQAAGQTNCVADTDPVNPTTCPVPAPGTACTREINEMYCGDDDCFYSNTCLATAAGFTAVECRNINCPASTATLEDCGVFEETVQTRLCGPYNCPYLSSCTANRAGWAPVECTPMDCPQPAAGTVCGAIYEPIVCASGSIQGGIPCPYSNSCEAAASGYDTSSAAGQCVLPLLPTRSAMPMLMSSTPGDDTPATSDEPEDDTPATSNETAIPVITGAPEAETPAPTVSRAVSLSTTAAAGSAIALAYFIM